MPGPHQPRKFENPRRRAINAHTGASVHMQTHKAPPPPPGPVPDPRPLRERTGLMTVSTEAMTGMLESEADKQASASDGRQHNRHNKPAPRELAPLPSAEDAAGYAARLQLQIWVEAFGTELRQFRSPAIAADLLLERVANACEELPKPHLLSTAASLTVYSEFAREYLRGGAGLALGIVDELCEAIYVHPVRPNGLPTAVRAFARGTYFDAFKNIAAAFAAQKEKAAKYEIMMARGGRVLDRAIGTWQRTYAKRLLQRWHMLAKRHTFLRAKYKKLFQRADTQGIVEKVVHNWRTYAHRIHVSLLRRNNRQNVEKLHEVHVEHRQLEEREKALHNEATRRNREVNEAQARVETIRTKTVALRGSLSFGHQQYLTVRKAWSKVVTGMFNDTNEVPGDGHLLQFVKDLLLEHYSDAHEGAKKINPRNQKLTPILLHDVVLALCEKCARRKTAHAFQWRFGAKQPTMPLMAADTSKLTQTALGERIIALFRFFSHDLVPPIQPADIVRGDQMKMMRFLAVCQELYCGSHLSLFFVNHSLTAQHSAFKSALAVDPPPGMVAEKHEIEEVLQDWKNGTVRLKDARRHIVIPEAQDAAVREMLFHDDEATFERGARSLYDMFIVCSASVERHILELCVSHAFPHLASRLDAFWPDDGVANLQDLCAYISSVADATVSQDRAAVVEMFRTQLTSASPLSFPIAQTDEEVQAVLASYESELRHVWEITTSAVWAKKAVAVKTGRFNHEAAAKLLEFVLNNVQMMEDQATLLQVYDRVAALMPEKGPAAMQLLLAAWGEFFDPNPYTPADVKLRVFFRTIFH